MEGQVRRQTLYVRSDQLSEWRSDQVREVRSGQVRSSLTLCPVRQQAEAAALSGRTCRHSGHHGPVDHTAIGGDAPAEVELGLALNLLPGAGARVTLWDEGDALVELRS